MKLEELKNKKILIVGRGIEGKAAYTYLKRHLPGVKLSMVDKNDGLSYLDRQKEFDIAVKSPGVKAELLTIPYTTATNIFLANAKGKVIGITGTKGKSTTSTLIFETLKKQGLDVYLGGNIGKSPLEFIDVLQDNSWTVLEMSSFQLSDLTSSPHIAILLMIANEHLDYHKTYENYINAKRNIFKFQTTSDFAILNRDYPESHESDVYTEGKVFQVSRERECENGCYVKDGFVWVSKNREKEKIIKVEDIKLKGAHNLENVCAAVMASYIARVSRNTIISVLKTFSGLPHRLELIGVKDGITFINDSLSTIPEATIQALETFPDTETLIVGGHDRGLDFKILGEYLAKTKVKILILFPETGEKIWSEVCLAISEEKRPEKFDVTSMEQAVRIAESETTKGKICLLSPASSSFGIFKDYKDRGEQFKQAVRGLNNEL